MDRAASALDLGFLGRRRFPCENRHLGLLDSLGFPWILSSESRLFNGLHGIFAEKNFARASPGVEPPARAGRTCGVQKGGVAHGLKPSVTSDFPQAIVARRSRPPRAAPPYRILMGRRAAPLPPPGGAART